MKLSEYIEQFLAAPPKEVLANFDATMLSEVSNGLTGGSEAISNYGLDFNEIANEMGGLFFQYLKDAYRFYYKAELKFSHNYPADLKISLSHALISYGIVDFIYEAQQYTSKYESMARMLAEAPNHLIFKFNRELDRMIETKKLQEFADSFDILRVDVKEAILKSKCFEFKGMLPTPEALEMMHLMPKFNHPAVNEKFPSKILMLQIHQILKEHNERFWDDYMQVIREIYRILPHYCVHMPFDGGIIDKESVREVLRKFKRNDFSRFQT